MKMRMYTLLPAVSLLLLCACASGPAETASVDAQAASATATLQAAATAEPTAVPSPTAVPLPFSGPSPRLAVWGSEGDALVIHVIELGSEEVVATVPVDDSWLMALSPDGRKLFNYGFLNRTGAIYDLVSGESRAIDLSAQVSAEGTLGEAVWSPSQQWLSFITHNGGRDSLWVYSLEAGDLKHVVDARTFNWSSTEDSVSYIRDNLRVTYNLDTGEETVWPNPNYETLVALLTHDGLEPDFNSPSCWVCVHPELGLVRDYLSHTRSAGRYHYDLVDTETMELLTHVATFRTERPLEREYYRPEVVKLLPLWKQGSYLLFVYQSAGPTIVDIQVHYYSAWSPSGEIPFTVVEGEQTNTLPDVIPMAISPDGISFVGFQFASPEPFTYIVESAVVVDLASAEILYEYPLSTELAYFFPPQQLSGVHMVWPAE